MAAVGGLLWLGEVVAAVGVTDGVVELGVGVEGVTGELSGEATGVAGAGLPAELGEDSAGDLTGDDGVGDADVVADGEVTGDAGIVVLKDGTKPGHLPQVICSTLNDQLCIAEMYPPPNTFDITWQYPRGSPGAGSVMKVALHLPYAFCSTKLQLSAGRQLSSGKFTLACHIPAVCSCLD